VVNPETQNKPTVDQMFDLQNIGVVMAKDQDLLKPSRKTDKAHLFLSEQLSGYDFFPQNGDEYFWTHRFTGRVARTSFRNWSMRIVEAFWVKREEEDEVGDKKLINDGFRNAYVFEWSHRRVLQAIKLTHAKQPAAITDETKPSFDLGLQLGQAAHLLKAHDAEGVATIQLPETRPSTEPLGAVMLEAIEQAEQITSSDCELLARDLRKFSEASTAIRDSSVRAWEPEVYLYSYAGYGQ
jgi:hypothetical protein